MKSTTYKNKYNEIHYDRINLIVPKGEKNRLKEIAVAEGISLNEYICRLLFKQKEEMFDRMQIAEKYRKMVDTITGTTKEGYTVHLNKGYIYSETGANSFFCKTKPDIRKNIKKCLAQDI